MVPARRGNGLLHLSLGQLLRIIAVACAIIAHQVRTEVQYAQCQSDLKRVAAELTEVKEQLKQLRGVSH